MYLMTNTEQTTSNPFASVELPELASCEWARTECLAGEPCNECAACRAIFAECALESKVDELEVAARRFSGLREPITPPHSLRAALRDAALEYVIALAERAGVELPAAIIEAHNVGGRQ